MYNYEIKGLRKLQPTPCIHRVEITHGFSFEISHLGGGFSGQTLVPFLGNAQFNSLIARQRDVGLAALSNNEDVVQSGGKKVAKSILDVNNIEGTRVTLTVDDGSDSPQVTTTSDHAQVTRVKLDEVHDLVGFNVQLDGIVHLNQWIGVTDCSSIVGGNERNTLGSNLNASDFAKLVLGFFSSNSVDGKAALDIIYQAEVLTSLVNGDNIHESSWVVGVGADFTVNFDKPLHDDFSDFGVIQGVLETVTKENNQRK